MLPGILADPLLKTVMKNKVITIHQLSWNVLLLGLKIEPLSGGPTWSVTDQKMLMPVWVDLNSVIVLLDLDEN
jgi:hypothetical protein